MSTSLFILGPSTSHNEPLPPPPSPTQGYRTIAFRTPATAPGGLVHLQLQPPLNPTDVLPVNVYAFFAPAASVPASGLTPQWFFDSGSPGASEPIGSADPTTGNLDIVVVNVTPSLQPYLCQTILEFPAPDASKAAPAASATPAS